MSLQDEALRLKELDCQLIKAVVEDDTKAFETAFIEYRTLRKSLKNSLLDQPVTTLKDANAVEVLRKIAGGGGLPSDRVIERLLSNPDDTSNLLNYANEEFEKIGSEIFYSWFSHYEYISGLAELRPLIVRGSVSEAVSRLIQQVKRCYAFQQYDAAYGLCRTVIEASIRDICLRCQLFPGLERDVVLSKKFAWIVLRDKVSSGDFRKRLDALYDNLCQLLHGRTIVTREETLHVFEETIQVVEQLYERHEL